MRILEVLARQHLMTLATIRPDGYPQATTVNYIHDDNLTLYFATDASDLFITNTLDRLDVAQVRRRARDKRVSAPLLACQATEDAMQGHPIS